jgi:DNA-binding LacI/PurR family transcriptional regulator
MVAAAAEGFPIAAHAEADAFPGSGISIAASDHAAGGADLMRWLYARGRRRPLLFQRFPADPRAWMTARWRGARVAARELGLSEPPLVTTPDFVTDYAIPAQGYDTNMRRCVEFLRAPLAAGVDAILASTDEHAWQAAGACQLLGREPGRDVLITGYDNAGDSCVDRQYAPPAGLAATIDKNLPAIAIALVDLVLVPQPSRRVVVPHRVLAL